MPTRCPWAPIRPPAGARISTASAPGYCLFSLAILLLVPGCVPTPDPDARGFQGIDDDAIADTARAGDWLAYGKTHSEQRFSPLTQINLESIQALRPEWYLDLPLDNGLVSTPLAIDGVLYFVGDMNRVRAVDAASGELLWEHDPGIGAYLSDLRRATGWVHNRGITAYGDRIFQATWDGRLIALDATTGQPVWTQRTFDAGSGLYITGAPKAFKGKVLIGNGGTEVVPTRGYVTAYDAETGELAWRFHIVPGNPADGFENDAMAMAANTWTGEWWRFGGGGNAFHGFTYDAELDQLYIGTGNGAPWNHKVRSPDGGDNLFLSSIVALDPDTGDYLWHYQTTPGESWDYTSSMDIVLADLPLEGGTVKALLHAPKNGFFYVIDRTTGRLLAAEPYAETTWAERIDLETGRPVEVPGARYENGPARVAPSIAGAHSVQPMSFSPRTGLVYLPTIHAAGIFDDSGIDRANWTPGEVRIGVATSWTPEDDGAGFRASLQAWDPVAGRAVWEAPQSGLVNGGTLTTAGDMVFQGREDGIFLAYDAWSGQEVWRMDLGLGITAPPISYAVGERQYIALLVGYGGGITSGIMGTRAPRFGWEHGRQTRRLVAFALDGQADLPPQPPPVPAVPLAAGGFTPDAGLAAAGDNLWGSYCSGCHGPEAIPSGMAPDLRASAMVLSEEGFEGVVRGGLLSTRGMPGFGSLTDDELLALRHYVRSRTEVAIPSPGES
jgi:quinohemoprotein ethanol dehydrogenase